MWKRIIWFWKSKLVSPATKSEDVIIGDTEKEGTTAKDVLFFIIKEVTWQFELILGRTFLGLFYINYCESR